ASHRPRSLHHQAARHLRLTPSRPSKEAANKGCLSALSLPLPLPVLFKTPPKTRHFDRSCSQSHREQRSGEIRFSTSTVTQPLSHLHLFLSLQVPAVILNAVMDPE